MTIFRQFGGRVSNELKERFAASPNWKDGIFVNLEETSMDISLARVPGLLKKQLFEKEGREPKQPIAWEAFDAAAFAKAENTQVIWYGHSALLLKLAGKTILIDPMLGPDASPIAPFSTSRFSKDILSVIDALPPIDLLLLSHDHYDHLDLASMEKLQGKVGQYFVALGCARHLIHWGVEASRVQEFDWWEGADFGDIRITFTPSRHFSGRGITDRAKSLWGGWVLKTAQENIYFSGDGGYGGHFKEVGERLGPFDFGFMECGQYYKLWHQIHMYPEEAVQAAIDAGVKRAMPVHWAGFALSLHHWKDPIGRFVQAADEAGLALQTPRIGALLDYRQSVTGAWWEVLD